MLNIEKEIKMRIMDEFTSWLQEQLNLRNWTASDLADRAGIVPSTVSRILSGDRKAGPDVCAKVAQALGENPDKVFRLAGLLPEGDLKAKGVRSAFEEDLLYWIRQLPESRQEAVLEIVKGMVATRARKG